MITLKNYGIDIENIRGKIYHYKKQKIAYLVTVTFITGKQKEVIIERGASKTLSQIDELLKCEKPDKIQLEYFKGDSDKRHDIKIYPFQDVSESSQIHVQSQFQGFGEAEISRIVDDRFQERQRKEEYEQLKERVLELSTENEEFQDTIDELEAENERLEKIIESKTQVRYYAGMLGDILESFGIAKDKVKSPLAALMGVTDTEETTKETETGTDKEVEEPEIKPKSQQSKRREIITLICDYLESTDNQTLAKVFTVFSEIEHNPPLANDLITFIESKKEEL
jgi:FtsZ-binding cell division protein ZapB